MLQFKKRLALLLAATGICLLNSCTNETLDDDKLTLTDTLSQDTFQVSSSSGHHYVGNLEYVLGDVKQALITNKFTSTDKIDKALDGFEKMGVNGIRIPIYPANYNPNQAMFDYFYNQAKARGFKIFANPAQGGGGARIANGSLTGTQIAPKNIDNSSSILINVVKDFANKYKCDWINPFNEDGRPGALWYTGQMNNIYAALYENVNGAELIGPCVWGISASTEVLQKTTIKNYITVAATHNLGWNHSDWGAFFQAAGSLPVWDSETHDRLEGHSITRLDSALNEGVDGLVLYNSWNTIDLETGELNSEGQTLKDKTTQYYFIENKQSGKRIKPFSNTAENSLMMQVPTNWTGTFTQWELVPTDNGYFRFKNRGSGMYFRPSDSDDYADIYAKSSFSGSGTHVQWKTTSTNDGYLFIENRATGKNIRSRNDIDFEEDSNINVVKINQAPNGWTGNRTQWKLTPAN